MQAPGHLDVRIVGREAELAALRAFVHDETPAAALLIGGEPGIGKTTLWGAALALAAERGLRVLSARTSSAEARLSFTALSDLLDGVSHDELAVLPGPQLRALEVALLRAEPETEPPEPRAIAAGFLGALRALAAHSPLLVAVDDVQWLDPPSADTLGFAARRLAGHPVRLLLARRDGDASALERSFPPGALQLLDVSALSMGAIRRLLYERLGVTLSRRTLRELTWFSRGNPLLALELGRALASQGLPEIGEDLAVPDVVDELFGGQVERLEPPLRRLLVAVALSADVRAAQLETIAPSGALDDLLATGLLVLDGRRVRAAHPLLSAAAKKRSRPAERRALHAALADVVTDEVRRAHHLALATERPDEALAGRVGAAADVALARGAAQDAVVLAEHALRLTPEASPVRGERLLAFAELLILAGEESRLAGLLEPVADSLPTPIERARAHLLLIDADLPHARDYAAHYQRALDESRDDAVLRATALARYAINMAVSRVEALPEAEAAALAALETARQARPKLELLALHGLAWARALGGARLDDLSERFDAASETATALYRSLDRVAGVRLASRGEVGEARACLTRLLELADERGDGRSYLVMRLHLCELALREGSWDEAERLVEEWGQSSDLDLVLPPAYERCRALVAAGRGHRAAAEPWLAQAFAGAEATGVRWDLLEARRARALTRLLAHEPERAAVDLRAVWDHCEREGVHNPGVFPVAPDLVEALVEAGELVEARLVAGRLRELAAAQEHPWGLASARRSDGLLAGADGADELAEAAATYERLGLRFDRARTLLSLGRMQRKRRSWGAARASLETAAAAFDELGSDGWAEEARSELSRVGARRPAAAGELTPAEQRVVALAVEGLSNKEIARALFVTVHTVEVHLSRAYAKLGVRSRAQLARLKV